jgi:cytochrome c-type biogenesis protein CcmE
MAVFNPPATTERRSNGIQVKFLIGGLILIGAAVFLIVSSLRFQQQYYITVDTLMSGRDHYVDKDARISGVVLGDTIDYDGHTLSFMIADIPQGTGEVQDAEWVDTLHTAAIDTSSARVKVVLVNQPKPDLLKDEAQAIVTGKLGKDGIFYADELLLKCPTRYQEAAPANG